MKKPDKKPDTPEPTLEEKRQKLRDRLRELEKMNEDVQTWIDEDRRHGPLRRYGVFYE